MNSFGLKNPDMKVSITLSAAAYSVIETDMNNFMQKPNLAGFINSVFENYKEDSLASIALAVSKERERLERSIESRIRQINMKAISASGRSEIPTAIKKAVQAVIASYTDAQVEDYRKQLREEMNATSHDSGVTKKIRLNNVNRQDFDDDGISRYYDKEDYRQPGLYVKAILEDYARLPLTRREEIYFKDTINQLDSITKANKCIRILYTDRNGVHFTLDLRPIELTVSPLNGYHYFIAILKDPPSNKPVLYSLRLSRINHIKELSEKAHITSAERKFIADRKATNGVQYIQSENLIIKIELTAKGQYKYRSIFHNRPMYSTEPEFEDGKAIYTFDCSEEQIKNYFFSFGKDVKILSPETLAKDFKRRHKEAFETYE